MKRTFKGGEFSTSSPVENRFLEALTGCLPGNDFGLKLKRQLEGYAEQLDSASITIQPFEFTLENMQRESGFVRFYNLVYAIHLESPDDLPFAKHLLHELTPALRLLLGAPLFAQQRAHVKKSVTEQLSNPGNQGVEPKATMYEIPHS